jgi:hypothetical protein
MNETPARYRQPPLDPAYRAAMLARVRDLVLRHLAGTQVDVYLFGSFARGDEAHYSDIDVALDVQEPLTASVLIALEEALEDSTIPRRVEIVDLTGCGPDMRERVRREGIRWSD